jgi:hypothetical protein
MLYMTLRTVTRKSFQCILVPWFLTMVTMKGTIFLDVTPYNRMKVYRRIVGTYSHLRDCRIRQGINHQEEPSGWLPSLITFQP